MAALLIEGCGAAAAASVLSAAFPLLLLLLLLLDAVTPAGGALALVSWPW
jgi:hypothetical protein